MRDIKSFVNEINRKIKYGTIDKNGKIVYEWNSHNELNKFFKFRDKNDILKSGYGMCWEVAEIVRDFLSEIDIPNNIIYYQAIPIKSHAINIFELNGKIYIISIRYNQDPKVHNIFGPLSNNDPLALVMQWNKKRYPNITYIDWSYVPKGEKTGMTVNQYKNLLSFNKYRLGQKIDLLLESDTSNRPR